MRHHRAALATIALAAAGDAGLGAAFGFADHVGVPDGLFFAVTTATTVGYGDITAHGWLPHLLAAAMMILIVPLFAATFSLFTSALSASHVKASEDRLKADADQRHEAIHARLDAIQQAQHPPKRRTAARGGKGAQETGTPGENG